MRVLGLAGSPRRGGNTDTLLAEVLKGAASRGAETRTVIIPQLKIMACQNCDTCLTTGICPFADDTQQVYQDIAWADCIVLAAPLHFMGLPSQTKALIDRAQVLWARKYRLKQPPLGDSRERHGLFVSTGARSVNNLFEPALATVRAFFASLDIKYDGMVAYAGIEKRGEIASRPEAMKAAFEAGKKLVEAAPSC